MNRIRASLYIIAAVFAWAALCYAILQDTGTVNWVLVLLAVIATVATLLDSWKE